MEHVPPSRGPLVVTALPEQQIAEAMDVPDNGVDQARQLHRRAVATSAKGRPAEAMKLLNRALRALPADSADLEAITVRTKVLNSLAYAEAETGSVADGLAHLDTATELLGGLPQGPRRSALAGLVGQQHALILHRAGRTAEALDLYDRAVPLLERAAAGGDGDPIVLTRTVMNRGLTYIAVGRPGPAERDMLRCVALAEEHDLPLLKAKATHNLGDIAQLTGDIPSALRHYTETELAFSRLAPDLVPRLRIDQARAMLAAGLAEEAARQLDDALPALRRHRISQDLAEAELARAAAALLQEDFALARQLAGAAQRRFLRRGSTSWAEVAALTRMRADAVAALRTTPLGSTGPAAAAPAGPTAAGPTAHTASPGRAARLADRLAAIGLTDEAAVARMLAVRLALRRGATDTARALVEQVPKPGHTTPVDHRMLLRLCRAELSVTSGDRRHALAEARAGLVELGQVRDRMGGLDLLCGTAVHGRELGELAVRLVLDSTHTEADARRLFGWLERTRAQVYRYEPLPAIDDPMLAERVAEIRSLSRALQQAKLAGRAVDELAARHEQLRHEVRRLDWYNSPWGRPRPVCGLPEVIERLGERALVTFTGYADSLAAVVVAGGRTRLVRLGTAVGTVEAVRQLHADLDALAPDHLPERLVTAIAASAELRAKVLDEALIRPLADALGDRELVLVPTGSLYAVPWGVLPSLRGRPVVVVPSATAWLAAEEASAASRRAEGHDGTPSPAHAAHANGGRDTTRAGAAAAARGTAGASAADSAAGASAAGGGTRGGGGVRGVVDSARLRLSVPHARAVSDPTGAAEDRASVAFADDATATDNDGNDETGGDGGRVVLIGGPELAEAVGEVRRLRSVYPGARVLDGDRAVASRVLAAVDGARLAHLAAHGVHEPDNALFSRLELADGPLFAYETARLPHPPEQVVLAACELALSHIRPGDEALGFAGALLASGSRSVVAAVSNVGDRAAAKTMDEFHRLLAVGVDTAAALAEACAADPLRRPFVCFGSGH
ncbi:CHAT domain-containing protein [Solihabitans fulvus]|uniref:CHAT domain-containing protein n=1 Tax=Solihabitans fulvus TaxID=1892852 RepID=A0A5B2XF87_9PSEU|nr:CHAT domain-containing protein [Solihabitans fulvus]KAA2262437.1 CHAT domain-containing protein [Solihabitans fulvus]